MPTYRPRDARGRYTTTRPWRNNWGAGPSPIPADPFAGEDIVDIRGGVRRAGQRVRAGAYGASHWRPSRPDIRESARAAQHAASQAGKTLRRSGIYVGQGTADYTMATGRVMRNTATGWYGQNRYIQRSAWERTKQKYSVPRPDGRIRNPALHQWDMYRTFRKEYKAGKRAFALNRSATHWSAASRLASEGKFARAAGHGIAAAHLRTPRFAKVALPLAVGGYAFSHMKRNKEKFYTHYFDY